MTWQIDESESERLCPKILKPEWERRPALGSFIRKDGLRVLFSVQRHPDHGPWVHVSCSRANRLPDFADIRAMRDAFIGAGLCAVEIHPPEKEYVNIHPFVRHLWARIDQRTVPDMRSDGGQI